MFDGRSYNSEFEESCASLLHEDDENEIRSVLTGLEWVLWEAIRGVFFTATLLFAFLIAMLIVLLLKESLTTFWMFIALISIMTIVSLISYCILRVVFWIEISRHIRGRKFGQGMYQR